MLHLTRNGPFTIALNYKVLLYSCLALQLAGGSRSVAHGPSLPCRRPDGKRLRSEGAGSGQRVARHKS